MEYAFHWYFCCNKNFLFSAFSFPPLFLNKTVAEILSVGKKIRVVQNSSEKENLKIKRILEKDSFKT